MRRALSWLALALLVGCGTQVEAPQQPQQQPAGLASGDFEGELEVLIVDSPTLTELRTEYSTVLDGVRHEVRFPHGAPPGLRSGTRLRMHGVKAGRRLTVESFQEVKRTSAMATTAPVCQSTGDQRSIVILVNQPSVPQPNLTVEQVREVFFSSTQRSLTGYWSEVSDGRTTTSGDVVGWYTLPRDFGCNESYAMRDAAIALADADVDFTQYNRIYIVHMAPPQGCDYGGLGTLYCSTVATQDGNVTASTAWLRAEYMQPQIWGVELTSHEGGHNLSLHHASSRDFGPEALGAPSTQGTLTEYGDNFSSMGYWNLGHYAAPHKVQLGWLDASQWLTLDRTDGTFTLTPYAASGGLKALKVRRGYYGDGWLWLEYRQPVGNYDSALSQGAFGGALIHYEDAYTGTHSHLLDFTPGTDSWMDPVLLPGTAGATWTDPYSNLSLTVQSATPEGLTVSVHYEPVPCVPGTQEVHVYKEAEYAVPGWDLDVTGVVTNHDSLGCPVTSFYPSVVVPSGWPLLQDIPERLVIEPGKTVYFNMGASVPADTAPGPYTFQATVTRDGVAVQGSDTIDVLPPCATAAPTVSLSPSAQNVTPGTDATYSVSITNEDSLACAWSYFTLASSLPEGWVTTYPDEDGIWLGPGESATLRVMKSVPSTARGDNTVQVQVLRDGAVEANLTATASIVCTPSAPGLSIQATSSTTLEPGGSATYAVTLTNKDTASCDASTFTLSSPFPTDWQASFSPVTVTLAPGQSVTATFTETAPTTAKAGSYEVDVLASRNGVGETLVPTGVVVNCTSAAPSVTFNPASTTVEAGKSIAYSVTVKNNDSTGCYGSGFSFAASVPSGWSSSLTTGSQRLESGQSLTLTLTTVPPETTVAGSYTVALQANRTSLPTGSGSATLNVTEPPLQVTLSVPSSSYSKGATVPITATVTKGTKAVAAASVRFNLNRPDGRTATTTLSTDSMGKAEWSYATQPRGTYTVTATATSGTATATSSTVSFTVN